MIVLGLNTFHADSSAALLRDGVLVAAAEEERFRRIKHWAGFPAQAMAYCLAEAGIRLSDVDSIAVNQDSQANFAGKLGFLLTSRPRLALIASRLRNRRARTSFPELIARSFPADAFAGTIERVEHHLAHLSSAFHVSPFDEAVAVSVDGFGDFASAAWGPGAGGRIDLAGRVSFPHSLGIFYQTLTQYLGFPLYGDEYKVMGLAPYGVPSRLDDMRKIVQLKADGSFALDLGYFRHHREPIGFQWDGGAPAFGDLFTPALEGLLGPRRPPEAAIEQRHRDVAYAAQAIYEEAFFHLLNALHPRFNSSNLALAGGCAMNSVANGKIRRVTPFRQVYVSAAAGDAGGAIGAAFAVWHRHGGKRSFAMDHAYWGPHYGPDAIAAAIADRNAEIAAAGCTMERAADEGALCARVAAAIAAGEVVGWFQGRMEWGPRALGNRSILGDPRRADMKEILNRAIKRRESFRPFAPSVLADFAADWFEDAGDIPFMSEVVPVRADKRALVPAVTHVDGSARPQTVTRSANPLYHRLIETFRKLTGVPMLLNTSFNENEPVVCAPAEALDCFLRTGMPMLVMGDTILRRC